MLLPLERILEYKKYMEEIASLCHSDSEILLYGNVLQQLELPSLEILNFFLEMENKKKLQEINQKILKNSKNGKILEILDYQNRKFLFEEEDCFIFIEENNNSIFRKRSLQKKSENLTQKNIPILDLKTKMDNFYENNENLFTIFLFSDKLVICTKNIEIPKTPRSSANDTLQKKKRKLKTENFLSKKTLQFTHEIIFDKNDETLFQIKKLFFKNLFLIVTENFNFIFYCKNFQIFFDLIKNTQKKIILQKENLQEKITFTKTFLEIPDQWKIPSIVILQSFFRNKLALQKLQNLKRKSKKKKQFINYKKLCEKILDVQKGILENQKVLQKTLQKRGRKSETLGFSKLLLMEEEEEEELQKLKEKQNTLQNHEEIYVIEKLDHNQLKRHSVRNIMSQSFYNNNHNNKKIELFYEDENGNELTLNIGDEIVYEDEFGNEICEIITKEKLLQLILENEQNQQQETITNNNNTSINGNNNNLEETIEEKKLENVVITTIKEEIINEKNIENINNNTLSTTTTSLIVEENKPTIEEIINEKNIESNNNIESKENIIENEIKVENEIKEMVVISNNDIIKEENGVISPTATTATISSITITTTTSDKTNDEISNEKEVVTPVVLEINENSMVESNNDNNTLITSNAAITTTISSSTTSKDQQEQQLINDKSTTTTTTKEEEIDNNLKLQKDQEQQTINDNNSTNSTSTITITATTTTLSTKKTTRSTSPSTATTINTSPTTTNSSSNFILEKRSHLRQVNKSPTITNNNNNSTTMTTDMDNNSTTIFTTLKPVVNNLQKKEEEEEKEEIVIAPWQKELLNKFGQSGKFKFITTQTQQTKLLKINDDENVNNNLQNSLQNLQQRKMSQMSPLKKEKKENGSQNNLQKNLQKTGESNTLQNEHNNNLKPISAFDKRASVRGNENFKNFLEKFKTLEIQQQEQQQQVITPRKSIFGNKNNNNTLQNKEEEELKKEKEEEDKVVKEILELKLLNEHCRRESEDSSLFKIITIISKS
ncbi:hypothetical protein ABK040_006963 [Willaertia magna]